MKLTTQQKNIINPYPNTFQDSLDVESGGGRNGNDYDYSEVRNRWVIDTIHDSYINYGNFPFIGTRLKNIGPITEQNNLITLRDCMAYAALYPQNAVVSPSMVAPSTTANPGPEPLALQMINSLEGASELKNIASRLYAAEQLDKFISQTAPPSQEEGIDFYKDYTVADLADLQGDVLDNALNAFSKRLFTINPPVDEGRLLSLRRSMGVDPEGPLLSPPLQILSPRQSMIRKQPPSIDFNDWTQNIDPTGPMERAYYNPSDNSVYFLMRTNQRNPAVYDIESPQSERAIESFKDYALKSILRFAGKKRSTIFSQVLSLVQTEQVYGDTYRPPPPAGYGRWLLMAKISFGALLDFPIEVPNRAEVPQAALDTGPSSLDMAKNIISNSAPAVSIFYKVSNLKENLIKSRRVLEQYEQKLIEDGIVEDMISGLDLEREVEKIAQFYPTLEALCGLAGVEIEDEDLIEIKLNDQFRPLSYVVNGESYYVGLGLDLDTLQLPQLIQENEDPFGDLPPTISPPPEDSVFAQFGPTVFSYVYNSVEIARLDEVINTDSLPGWSEFLIKYTYPNPNLNSIRPSSIQNKQYGITYSNSNTPITQYLSPKEQKALLAGLGKFASDGYHMFKDPEAVAKTLERRRLTKKQLYALCKSSVYGCGSGYAKTIQTVHQTYSLYTKKARPRDWVTLAVNTIRTDLVSSLIARNTEDLLQFMGIEEQIPPEAVRQGVSTVVFYERNPDQLVRLVEKWVNDQLDGCLEVLGDVIVYEVLDPLSSPKKARKYWKKPLKSSSKIKLPYKPTRDYMRSYRKLIMEMLVKYIQQLLASVLKDIISAALGCGPDEVGGSGPDSRKKDFKESAQYGFIRINDLAQDAGVSLITAAEGAGLINSSYSIVEGEVVITQSPPRTEQLKQYNADVSDFLTLEETIALLDGNASVQTVASIREMVNSGGLSTEAPPGILTRPIDEQREYYNSLHPDDVLYASLGINEDNIIAYFSKIGQLINPPLEELGDLDPQRAFCAQRDPNSPGQFMELGLSQAQLIKQLDQQVLAKVQKIKEQCEFLVSLNNIQLDVVKFFDQLPSSKLYQQFLTRVSEASKASEKALRDFLLGTAQAAGQQPVSRQLDETDTELYKFCGQQFSNEKFLPYPSLANTVAGNPQWRLGNQTLGEISFELMSDEMIFYHRASNNFSNPAVIARSPLAPDNQPNLDGGEGFIYGEYSARGLANDGRSLSDRYPTMNRAMAQGIQASIESGLSISNDSLLSSQTNKASRFMNLIANNREGVTTIISNFYLNDRGQRRLRKLTGILSDSYFEEVGDPCLDARRRRIGSAALASIQARITNFFLNAGPLLRVYVGLNTPDILNALASYLSTKMQREWTNKGLLQSYLNAMDDLSFLYSSDERRADGVVIYDSRPVVDPRQILEYTIRKALQVIFYKLSKKRDCYGAANNNIYEDYGTDVANIAKWIRTGYFNQGEEDQERQNPGSTLDEITSIADLNSQEWEQAISLYYVPYAHIIAMQYMFLDSSIAVADKFPAFRFYSQKRVADSDDFFLSAVNEETVTIFTTPFDGYPVTLEGVVYYSDQQVLEAINSFTWIRNRIFALEKIFGPVELAEQDWTNFTYATGMSGDTYTILNKDLEQSREYFNPIYGRGMNAYLDLYNTEAKRTTLYKQSLSYRYLSSYPETFDQANSRNFIWMRQRAFYERARLLGRAPADEENKSLINRYLAGYDLDETRARFPAEQLNQVIGQDDNGNSVSFKNYIIQARKYMINENSYDVNEELRDDFDSFWGAVGYTVGMSLLTGAVATGVGVGAVALAVAMAGAGVILSPILIPIAALGVLIGAIAFWTFEEFDPSDPDDNDCVKAISNDVRVPPGPNPGDPEVLPLDIEGDMVEAATGGFLGSEHDNTLDKIAMNYLLFELGWRSFKYKEQVDPANPDNVIVQLSDWLDIEAPEPIFPVYYRFESQDNYQTSIVAFTSVEEMSRKLVELQENPVFQYYDEIQALRAKIDRNLEIAELLNDYADHLYGDSDDTLDSIRNVLSRGSTTQRPFTSFVEDYIMEDVTREDWTDNDGISFDLRRRSEYLDFWTPGVGAVAISSLGTDAPIPNLIRQIAWICMGDNGAAPYPDPAGRFKSDGEMYDSANFDVPSKSEDGTWTTTRESRSSTLNYMVQIHNYLRIISQENDINLEEKDYETRYSELNSDVNGLNSLISDTLGRL